MDHRLIVNIVQTLEISKPCPGFILQSSTPDVCCWIYFMTSNPLQNYLNEFCYKFNRRYFGENLLDRLMIAFVTYKNNFRINNG
jgi:hypothetical protein